jgi:hypothetical protein
MLRAEYDSSDAEQKIEILKKEIQDLYILLRDEATEQTGQPRVPSSANVTIRKENIFTLISYIRAAIQLLVTESEQASSCKPLAK